MNTDRPSGQPPPGSIGNKPARHWLILIALAALALALLWRDHESHILGFLPWLILLACPLLHVFMHRGHGRGHHGSDRHESDH